MLIIMSETRDISKLADILHQNGDKVLNGLSKLSLNATLLQRINKEFELFLLNEHSSETNKFQVIASGNANSQLMQDLLFLHDFIQKTVGLKITNNSNLSLLDNKVDISRFKSIKYLEIKKVPLKEITGLKVIQSKLESLICIKCMSELEELLAECGGDKCSGFVWSELREVVISYNNIRVLDTSIALAPWLQVLDLSHNKITNVKALESLPNLKYINLSFNCLHSVPTFSKSARKKMLVLVVKNNYIEDLSGLSRLDHLAELDVSWNWVSNYNCLQPLLTMSALQNLCLKGNPISYHRNYKHNVVGYLHISASFGDFVFDGSKLSKYEKSIVGYQLCEPSRLTSVSSVESVVNSPVIQTPLADNRSLDKYSSGKKSGKVRLAVIPNLDDGTYEEIPADISAVSCKESVSAEHLITKKKIEDARATYGSDNWLRCEAGNVVQDILGLPLNETISSTPLDDYCLVTALKSENNVVKTTAVIENHSIIEDNSDKANNSIPTCVDDYSPCFYSINDHNNLGSTGNISKGELESKETSPDFEPIEEPNEEVEGTKPRVMDKTRCSLLISLRSKVMKVKTSNSHNDFNSVLDESEKIYLVSRIMKVENGNQSEELFLSLTDLELKEKDTNRGGIVNKWSISYLESCTRIQSNRLQLTFDTVKRDKQERTYEMEESEVSELYKSLSQILESRTLQDMNQVAHKCVSCSSQFSKIINSRKQEYTSCCPFCNSTFILEADDESPSDTKKKPSEEKNMSHVKASHNWSSSSGVIQGFSNQTIDKAVTDSSRSSIGSAASLDELNKLPVQNANADRSDSDIEILTNLSQSSIEVINGPSVVPLYRKKSSEERQIVQNYVLPDNLVGLNNIGGLTESSSSGSVTDSVCTTYENNCPLNPEIHKSAVRKVGELKKTREEKKSVAESEGNKNLKHPKENLIINNANKIQYSYTDITKVDHRIKLLLYSQIFESNNEDFLFLIRCNVLLSNNAKSYPSCVVCSNKKLYILKVIGPEEGDDASDFLKKSNSLRFKLNSITGINVLTWHQGFAMKLKDSHDRVTEVLILLRDQERTQQVLKYLQSSDLILPSSCKIRTECSQKPILAMQHLLVSGASENSNVQYFCLLSSCSVIGLSGVKEIEAGSVLINSTDLLLFSSEPKWLFDGPDQPPQPVFKQKISNLMNVETENNSIYFQFMNEIEEKEDIWNLTMETQKEVEYLINAVKSPWEEMFAVPLQVSNV